MKPAWNSFVFAILSTLAIYSSVQSAEPLELQGVWFGDGIHPTSSKVLLIQDESFIVMTPLGRFTSKIAATEAMDGVHAIEIDRYDGSHQFGLYMVEKTKLYLKLAAPGQPKLTKKDITLPDGRLHWPIAFERRPTQDGLSVLQRDMAAK